MQYVVTKPKQLKTKLYLPPSKSISNRVLILQALTGMNTPLHNIAQCDDSTVMRLALHKNPEVIDIQAAGTAMRFLTAYYCVQPGEHTITGTERMKQRPISILVDALRSLGADIEYLGEEGYPPLRIRGGELPGREVTIDASVSSQYISALMLIGAALPHGLLIHLVGEVASRPYIDLTLKILRQFGAGWKQLSPNDIQIYHGYYRELPFGIEADWSAASYWYEIMSLTDAAGIPDAEITINGLMQRSLQGDRVGADMFDKLGVQTEFLAGKARIKHKDTTAERMEADFRDTPDLAQTFVVTCCLKGIPFRFDGLHSLRIKETDRIAALVTELRRLGYVVKSEGDNTMTWDGQRCEPEADPVIQTYEDHRMAMAFAPACMALGKLKIDNPHVVTKSYPKFWDDLHSVGFHIDVIM